MNPFFHPPTFSNPHTPTHPPTNQPTHPPTHPRALADHLEKHPSLVSLGAYSPSNGLPPTNPPFPTHPPTHPKPIQPKTNPPTHPPTHPQKQSLSRPPRKAPFARLSRYLLPLYGLFGWASTPPPFLSPGKSFPSSFHPPHPPTHPPTQQTSLFPPTPPTHPPTHSPTHPNPGPGTHARNADGWVEEEGGWVGGWVVRVPVALYG